MTTATPLSQHVERLRALVHADERVEAALIYGSWSVGEADQFSDLDAYIFFREGAIDTLDPEQFVRQLATVLLAYTNVFGLFAVVFEDLTRAEFHFEPATSGIEAMASWAGLVSLPDPARAILLDRTGRLTEAVVALQAPLAPDPATTAPQLIHELLNWTLMVAHVFERGELARAHAGLQTLVAPSQLQLCRLLRHTTSHWLTPTRALEDDLSADDRRHYAATTSSMARDKLATALDASWRWSLTLIEEAATRWALPYPAPLCRALSAKITRVRSEV